MLNPHQDYLFLQAMLTFLHRSHQIRSSSTDCCSNSHDSSEQETAFQNFMWSLGQPEISWSVITDWPVWQLEVFLMFFFPLISCLWQVVLWVAAAFLSSKTSFRSSLSDLCNYFGISSQRTAAHWMFYLSWTSGCGPNRCF